MEKLSIKSTRGSAVEIKVAGKRGRQRYLLPTQANVRIEVVSDTGEIRQPQAMRMGRDLVIQIEEVGQTIQLNFENYFINCTPSQAACAEIVIDKAAYGVGSDISATLSAVNAGETFALTPLDTGAGLAPRGEGLQIGRLPLLLAGGGLIAAGVAGSQSSSSHTPPASSSPPAPSSPPEVEISGIIVLGGVISPLTITLYGAQGQVLAQGTSLPNGSYSLRISSSYRGPVMAVVTDRNGTSGDYLDEATGMPADLGNVVMRGVGMFTGTQLTLSITPLTEIAALSMGLPAGSITPPTATVLSNSINVLAQAFGLSNTDLTQRLPVPIDNPTFQTTDGLSVEEKYGLLLATLSGMQANLHSNLQQTLAAVAQEINLQSPGSTLSETLISQLLAGINTVQVERGLAP